MTDRIAARLVMLPPTGDLNVSSRRIL